MTTNSESITKILKVGGIGPVELTVEEQGDGQPFLDPAWGCRSTSVARVRTAARREGPAIRYLPPPTQVLAALRGQRVCTVLPDSLFSTAPSSTTSDSRTSPLSGTQLAAGSLPRWPCWVTPRVARCRTPRRGGNCS